MSSSGRITILLTALLFLACFFTRFYNLDWGDGNFFHPDENNMASAINRLTPTSLDPEFYAYGQFPLYLVYFPMRLFNIPNSFHYAVIGLRISSALFSFFSVIVFYLIGRHLFSRNGPRLILLAMLTFHPGFIQLAHFGTTESILIFISATNLFLSIKYCQTGFPKYILAASFLTGLGLATKITALAFSIPIFLSLFLWSKKRRSYLAGLLLAVIYVLISLQFFIVGSPYNIIANRDFLSTFKYETSVATGSAKVFYTSQFIDSKPYLFHLTKIFPYVHGLPQYLFSFFGFFWIIFFLCSAGVRRSFSNHLRSIWLIILISSLVQFLYNGQLYVKWTRFVSPLFFLGPVLSTYFIHRLSSKIPKAIIVLLVVFSILPGLIFLSIYYQPDIRLTASQWLNDNLPPNSFVLSEAGNVVNLPVTPHLFEVKNFDFYNLDHDPELAAELPSLIARADYILVPSRRIFRNQTDPSFPISARYYRFLFSQESGFSLIREFSSSSDLFLDPEDAEETWSVFDHPKVRVYQKVSQRPFEFYQQAISPN